ncbi:6-aminohexanoate-dimer hydrolase [Isoalcanivorax pacificus W11-5]|uniref:6-aminohexanoate-dimer hydrolase n=1 Tax=Isoalcanivorax pacificus W11-5 TaxID=391936 RepID=A0A0B4XK86_9GAMM|nr:serine hydrolase [Isoalcanivorax pacificus]AJD47110.1 6-aminohexanoate-dimer hydrolase [Isoalcanivorax pacificus W11-5]
MPYHPSHLTAFAFAAVLTLSMALAGPAHAETTAFPDAIESDPARLGWMVGSPPPPDRILRFEDGSYFRFPAMRWSVSHFRQLMPTINVSRGTAAAGRLRQALRDDIDDVTFLPMGSDRPMSWRDALLENYTDGIIVLHKGRVVYERYFGVLTREGQHGVMSVTKTFVGTLAAMMVADGELDPERKVEEYVPELARSAFGNATVRQLMDMTTGIRFSEDYADPNADVWAHAAAGNPLPKPADYQGPRSYYEFLQTVQPEGTHGEAFHYRTANTDALGWVLARVSGRSIAQLLSEKIWRKLGAEQDAYMSVDSTGTPFAGGGLNMSLRDLARFGEMIRQDGRYNGQQIIPKAAIADIRQGGSKEAFSKAGYALLAGWSYRNMWWVTHNPHGAFMARGVHGQALYIDPVAEMVIARFASHPVATNAANDPTSLPAYQAVAAYLMGRKQVTPEK